MGLYAGTPRIQPPRNPDRLDPRWPCFHGCCRPHLRQLDERGQGQRHRAAREHWRECPGRHVGPQWRRKWLVEFGAWHVGLGKGGDLGGLAGADAHCQQLAAAAGGGAKTWHAYLSTQARPGQPAINARDRIGAGPWYNSKRVPIAKNLSDLNGDTVEEARLGSNLFKQTALNEKGGVVNGFGDMPNT